jgi:hypothetical protein
MIVLVAIGGLRNLVLALLERCFVVIAVIGPLALLTLGNLFLLLFVFLVVLVVFLVGALQQVLMAICYASNMLYGCVSIPFIGPFIGGLYRDSWVI